MRIPNDKMFNPRVTGGGDDLEITNGTQIPDTTDTFTTLPVGALYRRNVVVAASVGQVELWMKITDHGDVYDWVCLYGIIAAHVDVEDLTDGGAAVGTRVLPSVSIPAGATFEAAWLRNVVGFAGDSSCTLTVGDGSDADRYMTGTPSVFTTVAVASLGVPSGTTPHTAAATSITLTFTSATDITAVISNGSGALDLYMRYRV